MKRFKNLVSPDMVKEDLSNTFGKFEMELAAKKIIHKAKERGTWKIRFDIFDFRDNDYEFIGLLYLLNYKWVVISEEQNCTFIIKKAFVKRLMEKGKII